MILMRLAKWSEVDKTSDMAIQPSKHICKDAGMEMMATNPPVGLDPHLDHSRSRKVGIPGVIATRARVKMHGVRTRVKVGAKVRDNSRPRVRGKMPQEAVVRVLAVALRGKVGDKVARCFRLQRT